MKIEYQNEWQEGGSAWFEGKKLEDCPYTSGLSRDLWVDGFLITKLRNT